MTKLKTKVPTKKSNGIKSVVLRSFPSKHIQITSEGLMNGTWQIKITGIKDWDLHDTEVSVLALFRRKKRKIS